MSFIWEKVIIKTELNEEKKAIAPIILSASRATDIPAFYSKWFIDRLEKGYAVWKNPFNQARQYIAFNNVRLVVFWTKNPDPLKKYLNIIDDKGINYYFQYTLNDYDSEGLEPNVLPLNHRLKSFVDLSDYLGKDRVIWRFDPLILSDEITVQNLLKKIKNIGDKIYKYTNKLVFSFADIGIYNKVTNNLRKSNFSYIEFDNSSIEEFSFGLSKLNREWNLELATCCEKADMSKYQISHNKCIDDILIAKLFSDNEILMKFLGLGSKSQLDLFADDKSKRPNLKDKGQRKICGCIISKDIGEYNTCNHLCLYCYANYSSELVKKNINSHNPTNESIIT